MRDWRIFQRSIYILIAFVGLSPRAARATGGQRVDNEIEAAGVLLHLVGVKGLIVW